MARFWAVVTVPSCDVAARRAACLPSLRARTYAVCVDGVVSLSRKAHLPCAGSPMGRAPLFPFTDPGVAVEAAPAAFNGCEDVVMPVASFELRGAAPALLTEI